MRETQSGPSVLVACLAVSVCFSLAAVYVAHIDGDAFLIPVAIGAIPAGVGIRAWVRRRLVAVVLGLVFPLVVFAVLYEVLFRLGIVT